MRAPAFRIVSVLALSLVLAGPAAARVIDKHFHESFDVEPGAVLHLEHGDGDVTIEPWDQNVIDVEVTYRAELTTIGLGGEPDFDVVFKRRGDTIHVIDRETGVGILIGIHSARHHEHRYVVRAPGWVRLDLEGDDGDVEIVGWRAPIDCASDDGDVFLDDVDAASIKIALDDGDLRADFVSGEMTIALDDGDLKLSRCESANARVRLDDGDAVIEECGGNFEVVASDGDVELERHRAGRLRIRADDGDIELDLAEAKNLDLDVEADEGDVTVRLAPGTSARFELETDDGEVRVDLPGVERPDRDAERARGTLRDGSGSIRLHSGEGNVTLRESP